MFPQHLGVDLAFEAFNVSAKIPLAPLERAFEALQFRNRESRARDQQPELRPCIQVRVVCLKCQAPVYCLTSVTRLGELLRACRACGHEFPVST